MGLPGAPNVPIDREALGLASKPVVHLVTYRPDMLRTERQLNVCNAESCLPEAVNRIGELGVSLAMQRKLAFLVLDTKPSTDVFNQVALVGREILADRLEAKPAERIAMVRDQEGAVTLDNEDLDEVTVWVS